MVAKFFALMKPTISAHMKHAFEVFEADIQGSCYLLLTGTKLCDVGVVAVPLWPEQWLS